MSINITLFDIETQNWHVRSNTKNVLEILREIFFQSQMLFRTSNIAKIYGLVTFLLCKLKAIFFRNYVDIKLPLEFIDSFGKFWLFFTKNHFWPRNSKFKSQINYWNSYRNQKRKKNVRKNYKEPDAFSDKQYCENWLACNFFAVRVRMLFFLIEKCFWKMLPSLSKKSLEVLFIETPCTLCHTN